MRCCACLAEPCLGGQEEQQECVMLHSAGNQLGHYSTHTHTHILCCSSVSTVPSHCLVNYGLECVCVLEERVSVSSRVRLFLV